jgi:hypothetical protein
VGSPTFTITGGTGMFAGASGGGTFKADIGLLEDDQYFDAEDPGDWIKDTWTGTLAVPGATFDLTAPVINGAHPKTVVAAKGAKSARVVYAVTAHDNIDGSVPSPVTPPSAAASTDRFNRVPSRLAGDRVVPARCLGWGVV